MPSGALKVLQYNSPMQYVCLYVDLANRNLETYVKEATPLWLAKDSS